MHLTNPKCTFIHIPKCAGTSVENSMRVMADDYQSTTSLYGYGDGMCRWKQHLTMFEIVGLNLIGDLGFTFTIVRNPWDRAVSEWTWRKSRGCKLGFKDFTLKRGTRFCSDFIQHQIPQVDYLKIGGKLAVDYIARFEDLQNEWMRITEKIGHFVPLGNDMRSKHKRNGRHYSEFYDDETKAWIETLYAEDISTFGYTF